MKLTNTFGVSSHAVSWDEWPFAGEVVNGFDDREPARISHESASESGSMADGKEWFLSHRPKVQSGGPRPDPLDLNWSTLVPPPEGGES